MVRPEVERDWKEGLQIDRVGWDKERAGRGLVHRGSEIAQLLESTLGLEEVTAVRSSG